MILVAAYCLWLYNHVIFENFKPKFLQKKFDLNKEKFSYFYLFLSRKKFKSHKKLTYDESVNIIVAYLT